MQRPKTDLEMLRSFKLSCISVLKDFAESPSSFQLVRTIAQAKATTPPIAAKTLYVLDASFNPPTKAHHQIAYSALLDDHGCAPKSLLLLLATVNADKGNKLAAPEDRLVMMTLFAHELLFDLQQQGSSPSIDIGLIKQPYFHDKAAAVDGSKVYSGEPQQVHLIGYDTLIRIFNAKYYPPDHSLCILQPFLSRHRLRAVYRADDKWGNRHEQNQYVQDIADGKRLAEGAQRAWAHHISLVEGINQDRGIISSTLARESAKSNPTQLDKYVMPTVREWIMSERLYLEGD